MNNGPMKPMMKSTMIEDQATLHAKMMGDPVADPSVVEALQQSLSAHWTAIETYSCQGEHFDRWGYPKLGEHYRAEAADERIHAARLIARLELYDEMPGYEHEPPDWPRHDFVGITAANLRLETAAAQIERDGILTARAVGDAGAAAVLVENLEGSEGSIRELTAVLRVLDQVTAENYLANQT